MSDKPSRAEYMRRWREANPEQRKKNAAYSAEWRKANPEKVREQWDRQAERRRREGRPARNTTGPCRSCGGSDRYPSGRCKACNRRKTREWAERNPEKYREMTRAKSRNYRARLTPEERKALTLKGNRGQWPKLYGITAAQFDVMLAEQNGVCAICGQNHGKTLHVDHDHATGKVRQLLCGPCNTSLGGFRDDPALLESAIAYLRRHAGA